MFIIKLSLLAVILIAGVNSFPAQDLEVFTNPEPKGTCYISQENGDLNINCVRSLNTEQIEQALESEDNVEEESPDSPEARRICTVIHNGKMTTRSCKRGKRSVDQSENNVEEKSTESIESKITCHVLVEDGNLIVSCGQGLESGDNVEEESQESPEPRRICTVIYKGKMTTRSCKRGKRSLDDMPFEQNENDVPVCKVVNDFLLCQERDLALDEKEVEGFFETVKNNLLV